MSQPEDQESGQYYPASASSIWFSFLDFLIVSLIGESHLWHPKQRQGVELDLYCLCLQPCTWELRAQPAVVEVQEGGGK